MERKTVLLVEDSALVRKIVGSRLITKYDFIEASRYSEAIARRKEPIDLALIDYNPPDYSGFRVFKALRGGKTSEDLVSRGQHICGKALRKRERDIL